MLLICRNDRNDLITAFNNRLYNKMICTDSTMGYCYIFGILVLVKSNNSVNQTFRAVDITVI